MKLNSFYTSSRRAFTLLELLVVISIIAILAGILLPVGNSVLEKAKKTEAKTVVNNIVQGVKSYYTDYGMYPIEIPNGASAANDVTFDRRSGSPGGVAGGHNGVLLDVLRARNATSGTGSAAYQGLNARKVTYFENKDVKNPSAPRSGFIPTTGTIPTGYSKGDLVDPWGNLYFVRIDGNYSDVVENPYPATTSGTAPNITITYQNPDTDPATLTAADEAKVIRTGVIAWSIGKDQKAGDQTASSLGQLTTNADDVVSWQ